LAGKYFLATMALFHHSTDQSSDIFYSDSSDDDYSDIDEFLEENPLLSSILSHRIVTIETKQNPTVETQTPPNNSYGVMVEIIDELSQKLNLANNEIAHLVNTKQSLQQQIGFMHQNISPPLIQTFGTRPHNSRTTSRVSVCMRDSSTQTEVQPEETDTCFPLVVGRTKTLGTGVKQTTQAAKTVSELAPATTASSAYQLFNFTSNLVQLFYGLLE
jgi:hypothetical protein